MVDTVVMAIMGYFQLKGRPGALTLRLAQGRSQMLYAVDNSTAGVAPQVCPVMCFDFGAVSEPHCCVQRQLISILRNSINTDHSARRNSGQGMCSAPARLSMSCREQCVPSMT